MEGSVTLASIGGGTGGSGNGEIVIQGSQSVARKQSNATDHGFWLTVPSVSVAPAGTHVGVWINHVHYAVLTKLQARLGSATTAWEGHTFPLATYPAKGGWVRFWIDVARTPEETAGTFVKTALVQLGLVASLPAVAGNAQNLVMDAADLTTLGLLLTGSGGTWQDFVTAENVSTNKYGVVAQESNGTLACLARLTLGSATALTFTDDGSVLAFPDQSLVAADFMGLTIDLQNASTSIALSNGRIGSAGAVKGDLVVTGSSGAFTATNQALSRLRILTLTAGATLDGCLISGSGLITAGGATLTSTTVSGSTAASAMLWDVAVNTSGRLDDSRFVSGGTGHAIEFGSSTPATLSFQRMNFSGYGADDTTSAAIYNNSGKEITINIVDGGSPTVRNGSGASTILVTGQRSYAFAVVDAAGNALTGYEWRLYTASSTQGKLADAELDGEESAASSTQNFLYTYTVDTDVVLQVIHNGFTEYVLRDTFLDSDKSTTVILLSEENI